MADTKKNKTKIGTPDEPCLRCGLAKHLHLLVNYADGPFIGADALICPTVVFLGIGEKRVPRG